MPRKKFIYTSQAPYHVTNRVNNKDWYSVPLGEVWTIYEAVLTETANRYGLENHVFVLMANHFHLVVSTPQKNLPRAMRYFLTEVSRAIGRLSGRTNHIFGGRYRWSVLWAARDIAYVYKYVCRNPIRAGIVNRIEEYPYSSFVRFFGNQSNMPITEGIGSLWTWVPKEPAARARWVNLKVGVEEERLISLALRRYEFKLPNHSATASAREKLEREYGVGTCG